MRRAALLLLGVTLMIGCVATQPKALAMPEPSSGDSGLVAPVAAPNVMTFPFPFRGVKYRMTVEEAQGNVPGRVYVSADRQVDEATAKVAVMNACAFIGRFPDQAMVGQQMPQSSAWSFDRACL